jgi:hypothetical protein
MAVKIGTENYEPSAHKRNDKFCKSLLLITLCLYLIPAAGKRQYRTRTQGASGFIVFEGNQ